VEVRITVDGDRPDDLYSLHRWLQGDDQIRGRTKVVERAAAPDQMGAIAEALAVSLGGGGTLTVLAGALSTWLGQARRSAITVEVVSGGQVKRIHIEAGNAEAAQRLLRAAADVPENLS
jgi:predicted deacylase